MTAKVLMVQGTASSAGKSLLAAALCRIFSQDGVRVAPFKAQNMALNSFVTPEGREIGRSQAVQAEAAGISPHVDMNPVLLKPERDARSQVIVMGRPWQTLPATSYYERKQVLWEQVTAALARLRERYELVVIEGAGSPAEINLRESDIVNMAVARHADAPVLLVGDIDRGGVFASMVGTLVLLEEEERRLIKGLVINKFRGDVNLFQSGLEMLEQRAGVPVLGVIPYLHDLHVAEEDSVALEDASAMASVDGGVDIAVIRLPRISNFDDFDALALEPGARVRYVNTKRELGRPDAVILPGTKHTIADLGWLRAQGLSARIVELARQGIAVAGICGGYQMLGRSIADASGVESPGGAECVGLDLLPVETEFAAAKETHQVWAEVLPGPGFLAAVAGEKVTGYEIHMGRSQLSGDGARPFLRLTRRSGQPVESLDGAVDAAGRVWGTYLHGMFDNTDFRRAWLHSLGWSPPDQKVDLSAVRQAAYDRLAAAVRSSLDMDRVRWIAGLGR
ncbi:MAG: cobyric acid synthase CobQ [Chloroflexi bacterium]|nr:MAG: cobyric acid synthase CobQ [Chloroflexota bacterium]